MIFKKKNINYFDKFFGINKEALLNILLIIFFALYVVFHSAPKVLNADVLLNSIMSSHNLTLFYWGQDRLLNVLPFLLSGIKNSHINLYFALLLPAVSHFTLLFCISNLALTLSSEKDNKCSTILFIVLAFIFLFSFNKASIFHIAIGHIEYSASYLTVLYVLLRIFKSDKNSFFDLIFNALLFFIAIGINPSVVLFALATGISLLTLNQFIIKKKELVLLLISSILFFILWGGLSKKFGIAQSTSYMAFHTNEYRFALKTVIKQLVQTIKAPQIYIIFFFFIAYNFFLPNSTNIVNTKNYKKIYFIFNKKTYFIFICAVSFCLGYLLLFSASDWVRVNEYSFRYFIVIIYFFLFYFVYHISKFKFFAIPVFKNNGGACGQLFY